MSYALDIIKEILLKETSHFIDSSEDYDIFKQIGNVLTERLRLFSYNSGLTWNVGIMSNFYIQSILELLYVDLQVTFAILKPQEYSNL